MLNQAQKEMALLAASMSDAEKQEFLNLVATLQQPDKREIVHSDLIRNTELNQTFKEQLQMYLKSMNILQDWQIISVDRDIDRDTLNDSTDYTWDVAFLKQIEGTSIIYYHFTTSISAQMVDVTNMAKFAEALTIEAQKAMENSIVIPFVRNIYFSVSATDYNELEACLLVKQLHDLGEPYVTHIKNHLKLMVEKTMLQRVRDSIGKFFEAFMEYGK